MFLVVGASFPLSMLLLPLQAVGLTLAMTWWMAGIRGALFPGRRRRWAATVGRISR